MPRYFCDYCQTYLTHDSAPGRKQHNRGWKHRENVKMYYEQYMAAWEASRGREGGREGGEGGREREEKGGIAGVGWRVKAERERFLPHDTLSPFSSLPPSPSLLLQVCPWEAA